MLVSPLDGVWCLVAPLGNTQPNGMIGPVFLARREDLDGARARCSQVLRTASDLAPGEVRRRPQDQLERQRREELDGERSRCSQTLGDPPDLSPTGEGSR